MLSRAQVHDPAAVAKALSKLSTSGGEIFRHPKPVKRLGGGFYAIKSTRSTVIYGLVGNELVAGTAKLPELKAFATAPATPIAGAQGPAAFRITVGALVSLALKASHRSTSLPLTVQSILNIFGDVNGWAANDQSGLRGRLSIPLK